MTQAQLIATLVVGILIGVANLYGPGAALLCTVCAILGV